MKKKSIRCPYCGGTAVLRDASYVYGGEAGHKHLYVCQHYPECNAYVGVHEGTLTPLGTLADSELRNKRIRTHQTFDRIWKSGILTKKNAYRWMQDIFCLTEQQAHIGCFSGYMCDRLIEESRKVLQASGTADDAVLAGELTKLLHESKQIHRGAVLKGIEAIELQLKGYSGAEIARMYGVKNNNVTSWISKARVALWKEYVGYCTE